MSRSAVYIGAICLGATACGGVADTAGLLCPSGTTNTTGGRCVPIGGVDGSVPDGGPIRTDAGGTNVRVFPRLLDFETQLVGQNIERSFDVVNDGPDTASVRFVQGPTNGFRVVGAAPPMVFTLRRSEGITLVVRFEPRAARVYRAALVLDVCGGGCLETVEMVGEGVADPLVCDAIDFGEVPVGQCAMGVPSFCRNVSDAEIEIVEWDLDDPEGAFRPFFPRPPTRLEPAGIIEVFAEYCPLRGGTHRAEITARLADIPSSRPQIVMTGRASQVTACQLEIEPRLELGAVPVGQAAEHQSLVANLGFGACRFVVFGYTPGSDPAFEVIQPMVGAEQVVGAGDVAELTVRFQPMSVGELRGEIVLETDDPAQPIVIIQLVGLGVTQSGYQITQSPNLPFPPPLNGQSISFSNPDDSVVTLPIGFSFLFAQVPVSDFIVSTNGVIAFSSQQAHAFNNQTLPDPAAPNALLAWWWDDLEAGPSARVVTTLQGTVPNRVRVIQLRDIQRLGQADLRVNAEVRLYETTHVMEVSYGALVASTPQPQFTATVGWEDFSGFSGGDALGCGQLCNESHWPANTRITYTPLP